MMAWFRRRSPHGRHRRLSPHGRHRVVPLLALLVAAVVAGCGVSDSGGPERIVVGLGLDDTLPSTTTSSTSTTSTTAVAQSSTSSIARTTTTIVATENVYLYFISGTELNSISIPLTSPASLSQVMVALQAGPQALGAPGAGLRSVLPAAPPISVTDHGDGSATVELPTTFFDDIQQTDQIRAIGEIVLTLTSQRGIGGVRFHKAGVPTGVALGSGEQSDASRTVTRADYRVLIIGQSDTSSTTATATSTTTSSPTTSAPTTSAPATSTPSSPPTATTTLSPTTTAADAAPTSATTTTSVG